MTKVHESEYGHGEMNFHVAKYGNTLNVELTYPPWTDGDNDNNQCRYIYVNQEAVRASDGVRLHYDYERDGFVVEQPKPRMERDPDSKHGGYVQTEDWIEVGFFQSWAFNDWENGQPSEADFQAADERFENKTTPAVGG